MTTMGTPAVSANVPFRPIALIANTVAREFDVTVDDLKGECRRQHVVVPRQCLMYLSYSMLPDASTPKVARFLGDRHHSTIVSGLRRFRERLQSNPALAERVAWLRQDLADDVAAMTGVRRREETGVRA